jgi:uncharacterized membrane protein YedE/YeeE
MTIRPQLLPGYVFYGSMTLVAFVSLAYAWWRRRPKYFNSLPLWRQIIETIGILAVTLQALLFLLSFSKDRSRPYTFR